MQHKDPEHHQQAEEDLVLMLDGDISLSAPLSQRQVMDALPGCSLSITGLAWPLAAPLSLVICCWLVPDLFQLQSFHHLQALCEQAAGFPAPGR